MKSPRSRGIHRAIGFLVAVSLSALAPPVHAAWVITLNGVMQFQAGGKLSEIVPTAAGTSFVAPTCGNQGGTSLALVRGSKLAGVDPVLFPIVLVVSCLDNGGSATVRSRLNFINPINVATTSGTVPAGTVVKQLTTPCGSRIPPCATSARSSPIGCGSYACERW